MAVPNVNTIAKFRPIFAILFTLVSGLGPSAGVR